MSLLEKVEVVRYSLGIPPGNAQDILAAAAELMGVSTDDRSLPELANMLIQEIGCGVQTVDSQIPGGSPQLLEEVPPCDDDCVICLAPLLEQCVRVPCGHIFHKSCIGSHISASDTPWCPTCRTAIAYHKPAKQRVPATQEVSSPGASVEVGMPLQLEPAPLPPPLAAGVSTSSTRWVTSVPFQVRIQKSIAVLLVFVTVLILLLMLLLPKPKSDSAPGDD